MERLSNKRYAKIDNEGNHVERTIPYRNLITSDQCNTAQGTTELRSLLEFRPFDFPKPSGLIRHLWRLPFGVTTKPLYSTSFSGSATTAHAVMQLNAEDGGKRKFIMVPMEVCAEGSEAAKAGDTNIWQNRQRSESAAPGLKIKPTAL